MPRGRDAPFRHRHGVLRISLGHETTVADIDAFLAALPAAIRAGAALDGVSHARNERNEER